MRAAWGLGRGAACGFASCLYLHAELSAAFFSLENNMTSRWGWGWGAWVAYLGKVKQQERTQAGWPASSWREIHGRRAHEGGPRIAPGPHPLPPTWAVGAVITLGPEVGVEVFPNPAKRTPSQRPADPSTDPIGAPGPRPRPSRKVVGEKAGPEGQDWTWELGVEAGEEAAPPPRRLRSPSPSCAPPRL